MNRKNLIPLFFTFLPFIGEAEDRPKNILFIVIDDLRPTLGCYGDPVAVTPHIDAFAAKGFRFERAYCQQSVSGPSRASMLTGLRPDEVGVTDLNTHFREKCPDVVTLPQLFKQARYTSIGIGKIFHGSPKTQDTVSWSETPLYNLSVKKEEYALSQNRTGIKTTAIEIADTADTAFMDGKVTRYALETRDRLKQSSRPFFLAVGFIKPHLPFSMPQKYWNLYKNSTFERNGNSFTDPTGTPSIAFHNWEELRGYTDIPGSGEISPKQQKELRRAYYACVSFIDAQVGCILEKLKKSRLDRNTIVVIWGDNGFHLGEQHEWGKSTNFEVACRVPLLLYDPSYETKGREIKDIVESVDIYPTLSDLCGLAPSHSLSGQSLCFLMDGKKNWKNRAFSQFPRPYKAVHSSRYQTHMGYSVRVDQWRYTVWYDLTDNRITDRELYDLHISPAETENISGRLAYRSIEKALQSLIEDYKKTRESTTH